MFEKYGDIAQLFYCKKDQIYFCFNYSSNFRNNCPICGYSICYFCYDIFDNCCFKRKIYENIGKYALEKNEFCKVAIIYFIPYINSI